MSQLALDGIRREGVGETGDELDRHFTPFPLARVVAARLAELWALMHVKPEPRVIVEPSVGGGSIARAIREMWPGANLTGVDIDDQAEGRQVVDEFVHHDWLTLDWTPGYKCDLIAGNTPFSGRTGVEHAEACLERADVVALILPWECLAGGREDEYWEPIMHGPRRPLFACPAMGPRPWTNSVRQATLFVFDTTFTVDRTMVWPLPRWKL